VTGAAPTSTASSACGRPRPLRQLRLAAADALRRGHAAAAARRARGARPRVHRAGGVSASDPRVQEWLRVPGPGTPAPARSRSRTTPRPSSGGLPHAISDDRYFQRRGRLRQRDAASPPRSPSWTRPRRSSSGSTCPAASGFRNAPLRLPRRHRGPRARARRLRRGPAGLRRGLRLQPAGQRPGRRQTRRRTARWLRTAARSALRAERQGKEREDRLYSVRIVVEDRCGNQARASWPVRVAHDQREHDCPRWTTATSWARTTPCPWNRIGATCGRPQTRTPTR